MILLWLLVSIFFYCNNVYSLSPHLLGMSPPSDIGNCYMQLLNLKGECEQKLEEKDRKIEEICDIRLHNLGVDCGNGWLKDPKTECQERGRDLASVTSEEEHKFITAMLLRRKNDGYVWIGLNDIDREGNFVWADGSPVTINKFRPMQPDDWKGEDCTEIIPSMMYTWNDAFCTSQRAALCKKYPNPNGQYYGKY